MSEVDEDPRAARTAISPCVNVCALDPGQRFCQGCFRTLDEIAAWSSASNAGRWQILAAAALRGEQWRAAASATTRC